MSSINKYVKRQKEGKLVYIHTMKADRRGGSRNMAPFILCLGTRWSWMVSLTPWSLYPREKYCGTYWEGGSV